MQEELIPPVAIITSNDGPGERLLCPATCSAFEVVDATSDEQYFTVGIWLTLEAAIAAIRGCGDDYPGETLDEDVKIIEIRERKIGMIDWSGTGKVVARFKWERRFDEEVTEWRVTETPNTQ